MLRSPKRKSPREANPQLICIHIHHLFRILYTLFLTRRGKHSLVVVYKILSCSKCKQLATSSYRMQQPGHTAVPRRLCPAIGVVFPAVVRVSFPTPFLFHQKTHRWPSVAMPLGFHPAKGGFSWCKDVRAILHEFSSLPRPATAEPSRQKVEEGRASHEQVISLPYTSLSLFSWYHPSSPRQASLNKTCSGVPQPRSVRSSSQNSRSFRGGPHQPLRRLGSREWSCVRSSRSYGRVG